MNNYDALDLHCDPSVSVLDVLDDIDDCRPMLARLIRAALRVGAWVHDRR